MWRLAAFWTGGPWDGSYCCWFCFCPPIWTDCGVGGMPPVMGGGQDEGNRTERKEREERKIVGNGEQRRVP